MSTRLAYVRVVRVQAPSASLGYIPHHADHDELQRAVQRCRGCDLYERATHGVMGEGPIPASLFFVGEQPGDQEDKLGRPFVGPAGKLFDRALAAADVPRDRVYVTNAVKHFKWEPSPRGKRRLHAKPNAAEIHACRGWLEREIVLVKPELIVCLGATAAQVFLGRSFSITRQRGEVLDGRPWAPHVLATYHPSAILRADEDTREELLQLFERDLELAGEISGARSSAARRSPSSRRAGTHL